MKLRVVLRGVVVCAVAWAVVFAVQSIARSYRTTAESVQTAVDRAAFEDWSGRGDEPSGPVAGRREREIRRIAKLVNQLDFKERERARRERVAEDFFWRLSPRERVLFVDLTVSESMSRWMEAFDSLSKEQQRAFVEKSLEDFESGMAEEDFGRMQRLGKEMLDKMVSEGFRTYLEETSAETKIELAPLMDAINEMMQGLRRQGWEH